MRASTLSKLLLNTRPPLTWALLNLPTELPKSWRRTENCHDGALYEREDGLCARATGAQEASGKRWWHLIVGRRDGRPVRRSELLQVQRIFYPPHAMVLHALLPYDIALQEKLDPEQVGVEHLWWDVDGGAALPELATWLDEAWTDDA